MTFTLYCALISVDFGKTMIKQQPNTRSQYIAPLPKKQKSSLTDGMEPAIHISYQVTVVANLMAFGNSTKNFKQFGLNIREWRVLALLAQLGPLTAVRIVEEVVQDKANMSRAIAELHKKKLVTKLPNPKHKRSQFIWLTKSGMALYKKIEPVFTEQAEMFCNSLSEKEKTTLCKLLDKLKGHAERMREDKGL